jgi:hypothetical protein
MSPTQNPSKRLQTIVIIVLVIILLLILASYIYLGMLKARIQATPEQPVPVAEMPIEVEAITEDPVDIPQTSTLPEQERLEILKQLDEGAPQDVSESTSAETTNTNGVRTPVVTPTPAAAAKQDAVMNERLRLLQQLEEGE